MRDVEFDEPVLILTNKPGVGRTIRSAYEAADYLLHKWPTDGGTHHRRARESLLKLLEGTMKPVDARKAFEAAADEADIRIGGPIPADSPIAKFLAKHKPSIGVTVPRPRKR